MKALIIPGLSSPCAPSYEQVYNGLRDSLKSQGFDEVELIFLPGQRKGDPNYLDGLSLSGAIDTVRKAMRRQSEERSCRLIGQSFGATVVLAAAVEEPWECLEKVICWGPVPFWRSWECFWKGVGRERVANGTRINSDQAFFQGLWPVEHLLKKLAYPIQVRIASGEMDEICPTYYVDYLKGHARSQGLINIEFKGLGGAGHVVRPDEKAWPAFINIMTG